MESQAQTLARGLRVLDILADSDGPLSIGGVCGLLGVHRSVGYRLIRTLEGFGLVVRDSAGDLFLGPHLATLARGVATRMQADAQSVLRELADRLEMTAFLVVLDDTECVTIVTVEPRTAVASIVQRPGSRHSVLIGAPGVAIQSLLTTADRAALGLPMPEHPDVAIARRQGFASSEGEVLPGVTAVAAPVRGTVRAAVAVLFVARDRGVDVAAAVQSAAIRLAHSNR